MPATASHKLISIIISLAVVVPSTHAHTEIQTEKQSSANTNCVCIYKRACRKPASEWLYACRFVCLSFFFFFLFSSFCFPCTSPNTCCEICICAFLDSCRKTCYVDITLRIAATSRWQLEKRWDVFLCKWQWGWRKAWTELKQGQRCLYRYLLNVWGSGGSFCVCLWDCELQSRVFV